MNIVIVGTGYVGLVTGVCFADLGHHVVCIDKDSSKVSRLSLGQLPFYETGLDSYVGKLTKEGKLSFSVDPSVVATAEIVVIAVGTPQKESGGSDLTDLKAAVLSIAPFITRETIIMIKSTVPIGTNEKVRQWILEKTNVCFEVVFVPEFMREGTAIHDMLNPDRVIIGSSCSNSAKKISELHSPLTDKFVITDLNTAEMIKYASNAFLATKISFINEMANLCDKVGADITTVAVGMGLDPRIGSSFLRAGIGYGGSCFPKDTNALIQIASDFECELKLLKSVIEVNLIQRELVISMLREQLGSIRGKVITIWGVSFKPNTDDVRSAPSLDIIPQLVDEGAILNVYDPAAMSNFRFIYDNDSISWSETPIEAAKGSNAICLLTEWQSFIDIDLKLLIDKMLTPVIVDCRNAFNPQKMIDFGFYYSAIGRPGYKKRFVV